MKSRKEIRDELADFRFMACTVSTKEGRDFVMEGLEKYISTLVQYNELKGYIREVRRAITDVYRTDDASHVVPAVRELEDAVMTYLPMK